MNEEISAIEAVCSELCFDIEDGECIEECIAYVLGGE